MPRCKERWKRVHGKQFVGLDVDLKAPKSVTNAGAVDAVLSRSFSLGMLIKKLIEDNISILKNITGRSRERHKGRSKLN